MTALPALLYPDRGKSVLIVEDDDDSRTVVSDALRAGGYRVYDCGNGADARRFLEDEYYQSQRRGEPAWVPNLILLDLMMPVMTGLAFYLWLRTTPAFAGVPVVVMTGYSLKEFEWEIRTAGMECPLEIMKPLSLERLLVTVARESS